MKVAAIIPARSGSRRLKDKNIYPFRGYPMMYWAIKACLESRYNIVPYVSSDSDQYLRIAEQYGAIAVKRPEGLSADKVFKQDVIIDACNSLKDKPDIVISLQPNSPEIRHAYLDEAIEKFLKYNLSEILSVNSNLIQNAAFRIMKYDYVFQKSLSTYCGVYICDLIDVHSIEDIRRIEGNGNNS